MKNLLLIVGLITSLNSMAQTKKPLTHSVYDGWKSVGERKISNDGNYIVYAINPQEGDGQLTIKNTKSGYEKSFARGYSAIITEDSKSIITEDSKYAIFKIKPAFQESRQAKIKKKKPDDLPKDSMVVVLLGTDSIFYVDRVKSFKTPEKGAGWLAYHLEKPLPDTAKKKPAPDSLKLKIDKFAKLADSMIRQSLDSVKGKINKEEVIGAAKKAVKEIYKKADDEGLNEWR